MSEVHAGGIVPLPCAAEIIYEGKTYKWSSGQATITTTVADVICGVAVKSSLDDEGAAKTLTAGDKFPFFMPGCNKIVKMASLASITWNKGEAVYGGQTADADGLVSNVSDNSAVLIGHYMGPEGVAVATAGDLIDVLMDVGTGGA